MNFRLNFFLFKFFSLTIIFSFIFATAQAYAFVCPDYMFKTDLAKGATHEDVKVMQEILNLDRRTVVANTGAGSKGKETEFFGVGTREALKRFQALFIEYIGIANGKFGPRTRTTMNAVCKGPFFTGGTGGVYDTSTSTKDTISPLIAAAGPESTAINQAFRAYLGANEALKTPIPTGLIIANATAGEFRKISSTTFSFLVTPNQDSVEPITLQFEADSVADLVDNKNENASNEWIVKIIGTAPNATNTQEVVPDFDFPNIDLPVVTPSTDCSTVASVDVSDYSNPCYGRAPTSYASMPNADQGQQGGGGAGGGMEQIMGLLQGLMKGLGGLGGGAKGTDGGTEGGKAYGDCSKLPTTQLSGKLGAISGRYGTVKNLGGGFFQSNGGIDPPMPIYGFKLYPSPKICQQSCPGVCMGACCNPQQDITGQIVKGEVSGDKNKFNYLSN